MLKIINVFFYIACCLFLFGCAQINTKNQAMAVLATPLQVTIEEEQVLGQLVNLLNQEELLVDEQAELLYQRGILFDRMGLRALALLDFRQALNVKPDFPKAWNLLGLYMLQEQEYKDAYEAFDAVLELDPKADYIYLNRGIALYYGQRLTLAKADLEQAITQKPEDPYRWLWWYVVMAEAGETARAKTQLSKQYRHPQHQSWGWKLLGLLSGDLAYNQLLTDLSQQAQSNQVLAQKLCEAYFYMGKQAQLQQQQTVALSYFRLALSNNVQSFLEHRFARLEIERMFG